MPARREWLSRGLDPDRLWLIVYPGITSAIVVTLAPALWLVFRGSNLDPTALGALETAVAAGAAAAACCWAEAWRRAVPVPVAAGGAGDRG